VRTNPRSRPLAYSNGLAGGSERGIARSAHSVVKAGGSWKEGRKDRKARKANAGIGRVEMNPHLHNNGEPGGEAGERRIGQRGKRNFIGLGDTKKEEQEGVGGVGRLTTGTASGKVCESGRGRGHGRRVIIHYTPREKKEIRRRGEEIDKRKNFGTKELAQLGRFRGVKLLGLYRRKSSAGR